MNDISPAASAASHALAGSCLLSPDAPSALPLGASRFVRCVGSPRARLHGSPLPLRTDDESVVDTGLAAVTKDARVILSREIRHGILKLTPEAKAELGRVDDGGGE